MVVKLLFLTLMSSVALAAPALTTKSPVRSRSFIFASVSYNWWQDTMELIDQAGTRFGVTTNSHGTCGGLGYIYRRARWDFTLHGCALIGQSDVVGPANSGFPRKDVETLAIFASPGFQYRTSGQVSIGVDLVGVFRSTEWGRPPTGWKIESDSRISGGAVLNTQWRISRVVLHQKVGPIYKMGTLWSLGLDYIF